MIIHRTLQKRELGLLIVACVSPVFLIFAYFGDPGRGRAASMSIGMMVIVFRKAWHLRSKPRFWLTLLVIATLHAVLLVYVPWNNKALPGVVLVPVGFVDYLVVYAIVRYGLLSTVLSSE